MKTLITFALSIFLSFPILAQTDLSKGESLYEEAKYEEALEYFEKLAVEKKEQEDWENLVLCQNKVALCLTRLGEYSRAHEILDEDLDLITSKNISNTSLLAEVYRELGELDLSEGDLANAHKSFEKEASLFSSSTPLETQAINKNNLGLVEAQLGNTHTAYEYMKQALALRQEDGNQKGVADLYNNIGLLYASSDEALSLSYYDKALNAYASSVGEDHPAYLNTLNNKAIIYRSNGSSGNALSVFETVLEKWKTIYGKEHPNVAFTYSNIGQTYLDLNMIDTALVFQKKALEIYKKAYGEHHPELSNTYNHIANIYRTKKEYTLALKYVQQSLIANCLDFDATEELKSPNDTSNCLNRQLLAVTLHLKAQLFSDRHYNQTLKISDLKASLYTLLTADKVIEEQRHFLTNKSDKISLGKLAAEVYEDGIATAFTLSQNSVSHKKEYLGTAFQFSEKSKAAVLLESIADANAKTYAEIPASVLQKEQQIINQITRLNNELIQGEDPEKRNHLLELNKEYKAFILDLEEQYPSYYDLKYNVSLATVPEIQSNLDYKSVLISYFIAESSQKLYIFKISKKSFSVLTLPLIEDFDKQITGFRNSILFSASAIFGETSYRLYKQLFPKKIPQSLTNVIIIPDGRLSIIPFEALLTQKINKGDKDFFNYAYLTRSKEIVYNFSATLYLQSLKKGKNSAGNNSALLCAPISFDGLPELPGTSLEIDQIDQILKKNGIKTTSSLYDNASETQLKSNNISNYKYIHLATHGIVNEKYPELSQIYLSSDNINDGNLFTGEIYSLKLNAKLVTLSACETGLGKISRGEGIVGLSRSLVFSGSENLVVSYWPVADESTAELMINFYTFLVEEQDISKALHRAKLEFLKNKKLVEPYYWAPFILIGN